MAIYRGFIRTHRRGCSPDYQNAFLRQCAQDMGYEFKGYLDLQNLFSEIQAGDLIGVFDLDLLSTHESELKDILSQIKSRGGIVHSGGGEVEDLGDSVA